MNALTVYQPWAWAIVSGPKDVENRTWLPPASRLSVGDLLAIHAAARPVDRAAVAYLEIAHGLLVPRGLALVRSAIVGVCVYGGPLRLDHYHDHGWHERGMEGWFLACRRPLPKPVFCRGAQGLWTLPRDVEEDVREQLELELEPTAAGGDPERD